MTVPEDRQQWVAGLGRRVVLADDHRLLREGVRRALEDAGMLVVGEASDGQEAIRLVDQLRPEVVLMDVAMPVLDGIAATRVLVQRHPQLAIIALTMFTDPTTLARVREAGAAGWLGKDCTSDEIVEAVRNTVAGTAMDAWVPTSPTLPLPARSAHGLTARECEVLDLVAEGASTAQLASRLYISPRTVKNHLASIYAKLDARDRTQALVQAAKLGIVHLR
ncbi:MAG: response regulator [Acidimicrobiales bacterium]